MENQQVLDVISNLKGRKNYEEKKSKKLGFNSLYEYIEDKLAKKVFAHFGKWLGKNLVSSIRVLDIHTILLGGGVSKAFKYMEEPMMNEIKTYLDDYYTNDLVIQKASLKNEAGIIGAATLNF